MCATPFPNSLLLLPPVPQRVQARSLAALRQLASLCSEGRFGSTFRPEDLRRLASYRGGAVTTPGFSTSQPAAPLSDPHLSVLSTFPPSEVASCYRTLVTALAAVEGKDGAPVAGAGADGDDGECLPDVRVLEPLIESLLVSDGDALLPRIIRSHPALTSKPAKGKKGARAG